MKFTLYKEIGHDHLRNEFKGKMDGILKHQRYPSIFAPVIYRRTTALYILGASALQILLAFFELPGWKCPILHGAGIPCPGCGLSQALVALLQGEWQAALTIHAFAPVLLLALILTCCAGVLPEYYRQRLIVTVERVEIHTGISAFLLISLVVYWAIRLVSAPIAFIQLMKAAFPIF